MSQALEQLNDRQREAAETVDENVRIIAGAGSGKTRVLMARIEYLVEDLDIWPSHILAITFTNKATNEMKERLEKALGDAARYVRVSTIHSLCVRMLREDGKVLGYPSNFLIIDSDDQKSLIRTFYREMHFDSKDLKPAWVLSRISRWKTDRITPDMALDASRSGYDNDFYKAALLYERYQARLDEMKVMDFDDLLINANKMLKNKEVREKWQSRFDFIHVDEFQDIDPIQYDIIKKLKREDANLCVVGDPDQTIYSFRGARLDHIMNFEKDFSPCKTVILDRNYRSTQSILNGANGVIQYNKSRVKKDLFTDNKDDSLIELLVPDDYRDEAALIVDRIRDLKKSGKYTYDQMAVLYRSNYLSRPIESALLMAGIPYRIFGGIRFYARQEIKDILAYLSLLRTGEDLNTMDLDVPLTRIINVPARGIGAKTIETLQDLAAEKKISMYEAMKDPETLKPAPRKKIQAFYAMVEKMKEKAKTMKPSEIIDMVLEETGYQDWLDKPDNEERLDNVHELQNDIAAMEEEDPDMILDDYLQHVALISGPEEADSASGVSLMTIHAAKGLEFPVVFVSGVNENVFPSDRSITESGNRGLEEERRLMYVAMTRAKERLFISYNGAYSYYSKSHGRPSRFIDEIPEEYVAIRSGRSLHMPSKKEAASDSSSKTMARSKKRLVKGDLCEHNKFGTGVVISVDDEDDTAVIAFSAGIKKIRLSYKGLGW